MIPHAVVKEEINRSVRDGRDAYDQYESFVSRNFCKLSYRIERDSQFGIRSRLQSCDGFMIGRFMTTAGRGDLIRTQAAINSDGHSRLALYIPLHGDQELQQFSRTEICKPGSLALLTMGEPFRQRKLGDNDTIYFFMPQSFVDQRLTRSEDLCARTIPIDKGIRRLAYDSVVSLQRDAADMNDMEFGRAARVLGELILVAFEGSADIQTETSFVRSSNLARAKRVVRARLGDIDFTITDLTRDCGISLRYLHQLFQAEGITVSEFIKQQRLQQAFHMLEDGPPGTTVTDVSFSCGFSNTSQFSTAFRHAFSRSPRDVLRRWG